LSLSLLPEIPVDGVATEGGSENRRKQALQDATLPERDFCYDKSALQLGKLRWPNQKALFKAPHLDTPRW
jgi:hypothetical protein